MIEEGVVVQAAWGEGEPIPRRFTCDGDDLQPGLSWTGVPERTVSQVVLFDDPDSPRGTWTHWAVWGLRSDLRKIAGGGVPEGAVVGANSWGKAGYGGPCPGQGRHRYRLRVLCLDADMDLPEGADVEALRRAMLGHILAYGTLSGEYERS